jgi:parallel beta-helix repeat protein
MLSHRTRRRPAYNRHTQRKRMRPVLDELETRWLLSGYVVNDSGDLPLDFQKGPAETENGTITLRSAIQQVNIDGGGSIRFESAMTITPLLPYDPITAPYVTIVGPGPGTVVIDGSSTYGPGFALEGGHDTLQDLVVGGFSGGGFYGDGVNIYSNDNVLVGNYIGTNAAGSAALPNTDYGIYAGDGSGNRIGGTTSGAANVISGNGDGLGLEDESQDVVEGNFIGTNATGSAALPNTESGILAGGGSGNTIGGTTSGAANVISGNGYDGLGLEDESQDLVEGNFIGTNATGAAALPNMAAGILAYGGSGNTIGGTTAAARNIISGNQGDGVELGSEEYEESGVSGDSEDLVEGNFIGTNATGSASLPNTESGISADGGSGNTIGGTTSGAANVISGNGGDGLYLEYESQDLVEGNVITGNTSDGMDLYGAQGTTIQGNWIGTDPLGDTDVGNGADGIDVSGGSTANTIGGTFSGAGNTIAFNDGNGVTIGSSPTDVSTGDAVLGNVIYGNAKLGIDLGDDGVTENDSSGHSGPNLFQDFPVLTYAFPTNKTTSEDGTTSIAGSLSGDSDTTYRVEFFSNPEADPSGYGQGENFLGFVNVTTDSDGKVSFTHDIASAVPVGQFVSATATDPAGNTSEFSADMIVAYAPAQIRNAYGINAISFSGGQTPDGSGQTIAIIDPFNDPNIFKDVDTFDQAFGTQSTGLNLFDAYGASTNFLTVVDQTGAKINPSSTSVPTGDSEAEESEDVEWAHAIAPGAQIVLIECNDKPSLLDAGLQIADRLAGGDISLPGVPPVSVVSMSFEANENGLNQSYENQIDKLLSVKNVTYLASTGDEGAPGGYPAYSPNVVAVGGTSLQNLDSNGDYPGTGTDGEIGWSTGSDSSLGFPDNYASGGGASQYELQPLYQQDVVPASMSTANDVAYRTIPDVSFDADPATGVAIANSNTNGVTWQVGFGTSLGAPCWAGLIAIVNQGRAYANPAKPPLDSTGPTQTLQALYSPANSGDFNDITSGNNGYSAGPGYDLVTGLGTPVANLLIPDLVAYTNAPTITLSTSSLNLGTTTQGTAGDSQSFTVSGSNLTADIILTAPTGVELSDDGGTSYSSSLDLVESGGTVGTTTVFARITAGAPLGPLSGTIAADSTGATEQDITVSGTVTAPTITVSTSSLDLGTTTQGTAGDSQSFTVSGSNLTADIILTAPTGVELSDNGSSYSTTLDLVESGGTVGTTTILARIAATAPVGPVSGVTSQSAAPSTRCLLRPLRSAPARSTWVRPPRAQPAPPRASPSAAATSQPTSS